VPESCRALIAGPAITILAWILAPDPACSQAVVPVGDPVRLDTGTSDFVAQPSAALTPAGDLFVAWDIEDANDVVCHARAAVFDRAGDPVTPPFELDTEVSTAQPAVATGSAGRIVVAWSPGPRLGFFDGVGNSLGDWFAPEGPTFGERPRLSAAADGRFVVAFLHRRMGFEPQLFARAFEADGTPATDRIFVGFLGQIGNTILDYDVAMDDRGRFVVVWDNVGAGRLFDADGTPLVPPFELNEGGTAENARVAMAPSGTFAALFRGRNAGGQDGVWLRLYDDIAGPLGPPMLLGEIGFVPFFRRREFSLSQVVCLSSVGFPERACRGTARRFGPPTTPIRVVRSIDIPGNYVLQGLLEDAHAFNSAVGFSVSNALVVTVTGAR